MTTARTRIFGLNAHATYACRHSGACCTAGWSIPVEAHARSILNVDWLVPDSGGACPHYDRNAARCRVHRDYGEARLPHSCHHFPRRALVDDRGIFVTLSHFCPTAASHLLFSGAALAVVDDPPAFPATRSYDGLTATGEWPPLLRRNVLFDLDSFTEWERHLVSRIGDALGDPRRVLHHVAADAEQLRGWQPADRSLLEWTQNLIERDGNRRQHDDSRDAPPRYRLYADCWSAYAQVCAFVPRPLPRPALAPDLPERDAALVEPSWGTFGSVLNRYVAAKAFASWTAYQWRDIRTQVAELYLAASILRVECARAADRLGRPLDRDVIHEGVRASDLLLMHLVDRGPLVDWLRKAECDA